jgi:hypothetical protein
VGADCESGGVICAEGTFYLTPLQAFLYFFSSMPGGSFVTSTFWQIKLRRLSSRFCLLPKLCTDIEGVRGRKKENHLETLKMPL